MHSTPPSNGDFDKLRRLLALKRHELPPPGYFNHFSERVVARIEAAEADSFGWRRWLRQITLKPAVAGVFTIVALAVYGFGFAPESSVLGANTSAGRALTGSFPAPEPRGATQDRQRFLLVAPRVPQDHHVPTPGLTWLDTADAFPLGHALPAAEVDAGQGTLIRFTSYPSSE